MAIFKEEILNRLVDDSMVEIATKDFVRSVIANAKTDMIKWFVGTFIALALMIIGLYFKN